MVEELIAQGHSYDDVVRILVSSFGMSESDASLMVNTALGGQGDRVVVLVDDGPVEEPPPTERSG